MAIYSEFSPLNMVIFPLKMVIFPLKMVIFHCFLLNYQRVAGFERTKMKIRRIHAVQAT